MTELASIVGWLFYRERRTRRRRVPWSVRLGLAVAATGVLLDLIVHGSGNGQHDGAALWAHLVTSAGMVLALLGVFAAAITQRNRRWAEERS